MIREANKHDMPQLLQMMRDYSTQTPVPALQAAAAHDEAHVANLMMQMMAGRGFVLIDNESRGLCCTNYHKCLVPRSLRTARTGLVGKARA